MSTFCVPVLDRLMSLEGSQKLRAPWMSEAEYWIKLISMISLTANGPAKGLAAFALDQFMTGVGFDARLSADIERDMWEKWAMLAGLGAITCLLDGDIGQVARALGGIDLVKSLFGEIVAAIDATWRPLSNPFKAQVLSLLIDRGSSLTSSMYRDMKGGYPVEADQII